MKLSDLLPKKAERTKRNLTLAATDKITVAEVFDNFAPPHKDGTACDLVSFGPNEFFLVIQGNQANHLTAMIMDFLNHVQDKAHDSGD